MDQNRVKKTFRLNEKASNQLPEIMSHFRATTENLAVNEVLSRYLELKHELSLERMRCQNLIKRINRLQRFKARMRRLGQLLTSGNDEEE